MCNIIPFVLPISRQALLWSNTFMWYIYLLFAKSHISEIHRVFQPWFCAIGYIVTITATVGNSIPYVLPISRQALLWSNTFMWYIYLLFVKSHNSEIHRVFQSWFCAIGYIVTITATVTTNNKSYLIKSRITRRHRGGPCVKQIHFDVRYFIFIRNKIPLTEVARDPFY